MNPGGCSYLTLTERLQLQRGDWMWWRGRWSSTVLGWTHPPQGLGGGEVRHRRLSPHRGEVSGGGREWWFLTSRARTQHVTEGCLARHSWHVTRVVCSLLCPAPVWWSVNWVAKIVFEGRQAWGTMMLDNFCTSVGLARQEGDSMAPALSPSGEISIYLSPGFQHNAHSSLSSLNVNILFAQFQVFCC